MCFIHDTSIFSHYVQQNGMEDEFYMFSCPLITNRNVALNLNQSSDCVHVMPVYTLIKAAIALQSPSGYALPQDK
uniref:Uncharacterized protein n=1 Tax=Aegilops tauschii subsp. strangulata TaxID=200361 RepID=A0A452ZX85_AEGTS